MIAIALIFVWSGFVRSGLGFGGAALGLPLLLLVHGDPVFWLPIIGLHLLIFSSLTFGSQFKQIDWLYLRRSCLILVPFCLLGVLGLVKIPTLWMMLFIYFVSLFYSILWVFKLALKSESQWADRVLLALGGYVAGSSLTGAPIIVAVYVKNVAIDKLRNTLFVLWFMLVCIKMASYVAVGIDLNWMNALLLLPLAGIGHYFGLVAHNRMSHQQELFKQVAGGALIVISILGITNSLLALF